MDIKNLLLVSLFAAREAGGAILEVYKSDFAVQYKDDRSPLTLADRKSNEIILQHLNDRSAENSIDALPVLSEEGRDISYEERREWPLFWLIDPLDGTKEFIKRNGEFTVNIALVEKNRPILGVIYAPVKDIFYFAAKGMGSYKLTDGGIIGEMKGLVRADGPYGYVSRETKAQRVDRESAFNAVRAKSVKLAAGRTHKPVTTLSVVGSRSHATREVGDFVEKLKLKCPEVVLVSAGSSLKFCLVAEGSADIYPRFGPTMEWDTAAGQIIVEESGGMVLNTETAEALIYNKESLLNPWFIAAGGNVGKEILA